jgi:lipoate-protein ligase A
VHNQDTFRLNYMIYFSLPSEQTHRLSFYLAEEEYIARYRKEDECFFMWQVEPSVIFGRNQLIENEVNLDFCKTHNISTYRRKSGGGCVYADMSNIMFSYIGNGFNVSEGFEKYLQMVVNVLRELGVDAKSSGRNDILIEGKKVSGNAFYHVPGRNILHGTMIYDTNMENMVGSITPSDAKLISKGVKSVRQRIALLKNYIDLDIDQFKQFVRTHLCDSEIKLTEDDVTKIKLIEREYLSPEFIYGNNPRYTLIKKMHIDDCGDFEVRIELKRQAIKSIDIMGDFFLLGDIDMEILSRLKGLPYSRNIVEAALRSVDVKNCIMNMTNEKFLTLLF